MMFLMSDAWLIDACVWLRYNVDSVAALVRRKKGLGGKCWGCKQCDVLRWLLAVESFTSDLETTALSFQGKS